MFMLNDGKIKTHSVNINNNIHILSVYVYIRKNSFFHFVKIIINVYTTKSYHVVKQRNLLKKGGLKRKNFEIRFHGS